MKELEKLKLNYIGGLGKNRLAAVIDKEIGEKKASSRLDEIILCLDKNDFKAVFVIVIAEEPECIGRT